MRRLIDKTHSPSLPAIARVKGGLGICAYFVAGLALSLAVGTNVCRGAETDEASAAELVETLGSEQYAARQQAEQALAKLGIVARDELLAGVQSSDPEIRRACQRILAEVLDADLERRLKAFRDDSAGEAPDLPGWKAYREIVGDSPNARTLFLTLVEEETALMESLESESGAAVRAWVATIYQTLFGPQVKQRKPLNPTLVAALLLAMTHHEPNNPTIGNNLTSQLMQPQFSKLLTEGETQHAYRKLMAAWINAPGAPQLMSQKLMLVMRLSFRDGGLVMPVRILDDAKARSAREVAMAIEVVARLGGPDHAARLMPLLEDQRMCQLRIVNKKRQEIQIRDVALAYLIHLTKQKHAEYGMTQATSWFSQVQRSPQVAFNFHTFTFNNPGGRDAAMKAWGEWVGKNALAEPPKIEQPTVDQETSGETEVVAQTGEKAARHQMLELGRADRALVYQLNRAQEAINERRYADACEGLGMLLALNEEFYFQPKRETPLYQQLRTEAERMLGQLPSSGLKLYELRYGPIASAELRTWLGNRRTQTLIDIQRKYFFTEAGSEASYLLGTLHRTAGHPVQAAIHLERLSRLSPFAAKFEPALSLQLAVCWRLAGLPDRATKVLSRLKRDNADATVRIAGKSVPLFAAADDRLAWLDRVIGPGLEDALQSKFSSRNTAENLPSPSGGPYLDATSLAPPPPPPVVAKALDSIVTTHREKRQTVLPAARPLVVDDFVVYRDSQGIHAVDVMTGELRWESPLMNGLWHLLRFGTDKERTEQEPHIIDGLRRQLWEDPSFGQLSCNGDMVFSVEDTSFQLGPQVRTLTVRPDGRRELDGAHLGSHNQLAAYDVRSGKVKWELGGAKDSGRPLAGSRFCGPPLCVGDYLYTVVEVQGQSLLLSLDTTTGALLDRYLIDVFEEERIQDGTIKINGQPPTNLAKHVPGAMPVFSDGAIVCCTSKGRYVAVDLASRTVRWAFAPPAPAGSPVTAGMAAQQKKMIQAMQQDRSDQWSDFGPVIAGNNVLLTPWDSDKLYCLSVSNGRLLWSASREDGLYIAGVHENRVMIVGRGGARMVNLADGKPSFEASARWPMGAVPSGRGYFTQTLLHVPLASGEVAAVNLNTGRLVARSRGQKKEAPGNLVRVDDYVVSCNVSRLVRFPTLASRERELTRKPLTDDNKLQQFVQLTEVMLYQGKTQQVIDRLQEQPDALSTPNGARLFAEATLQWSSEDWKQQQTLARQVEQSLTDPAAKAEFLTRLVSVYQDADDDEAALAAAWRLLDVPTTSNDEMMLISPAHSARRGRFMQQTLSTLLAKVSPETQATYNAKIKQRLAGDDLALATIEALGFHTAANAGRLRVAAEMVDDKQRLQAELLLRRVLANGDAGQKAEATARLARLLQDAGKNSEAARFFAILAGPLADRVCLEDKTGAQLAELSDESPVRPWIRGHGPWQDESPEKKQTKTKARTVPTQWPLMVANDGSRLAPFVSADVDARTKSVLGRDASGAQTFSISLAKNNTSNLAWNGNAAMNEACATGHLMVVSLSGHILAIDQFTGKTLWSRTVMKIDANQWWMLPQVRRRMMLQQQVQQGLISAEQLPRSCAATSHYVAFQEGRILKAVDPLTGEEIWSRDDLPPSCEIQGDDSVILVKPEGSSTAILLSAVDGSRLGDRKWPQEKQLVARVGGKLLLSKKDKTKQTIELHDLVTESAVWSRQFSPKAASCQIDNCELAVLEPDGHYTILSVDSGEVLVEGEVKAEPKLRNVLAFRGNGHYLLIANRPEPPSANGRRIVNQNIQGQFLVEGNVHCIDKRTGKTKWTREVTRQAIKANYPPEAPVVTFFRRHQELIKSGNGWRGGQPETRLTCLQTTTGKPLHEGVLKNSYDQIYGLRVDPKAREVKIDTRVEQLVFVYGNAKK